MRNLLIASLIGLISLSAHAGLNGNGLANGFIKADFKREIAADKLEKLLATGGGLLFVARKGGEVVAMDAGGKVAFTLAAKSGEVELLKRPEGAAVTKDTLYVVDSDTDQVVMYTLPGGKYKGRFGAKAGGFFGGDDQALDGPRGIAVHEGVVYVADTGNKRIQMFGVNGVFIHTLDLHAKGKDESGRELPWPLKKAADIALDEVGRIYVMDSDESQIKVYDPSGLYLSSFQDVGSPVALAVAEDGVYVADGSKQVVSKFDFDGKPAFSFGSKGEGKSQTKQLSGLAVEKGQQVYIGDAGKSLLNHFQTIAGTRMEPVPKAAGRSSVKWQGSIPVEAVQLAGDGKGTVYAITKPGKDGSALLKLKDGKVAAEIRPADMELTAVTVDASGGLWVLDKKKKRCVKLDEAGKELATFGSGGSGAGQFSNPASVAVASSGLVFVADRGHRSVQVFRGDGVYVDKLGGNISNPLAIGIDPQDRLFVLDGSRSSVLVFKPSGELSHEFARPKEGSLFAKPLDMAVTADEVLVLDGNQVKAFDHQGKLLRVFGTKATGTANLGDPVALASSGGSTLFVADGEGKRVESLSVMYKPQQPANFTAHGHVHAVDLSWDKPAAFYVKAFHIYRSKSENAGYVQVGTSETNAYTDAGLDADVRYFYRVVAVSDFGYEGASSSAASATTEKFTPPALSAVTAEMTPWQANLKWEAVDPQYFAAYRIYQQEGDAMLQVGEVTMPEFTKDALQPETKYTFYVSVLSTDQTESEKLPVEATTLVFSRPPLDIEVVKLENVFSNSYKLYERDGIGTIRLTNNTDKKMEKIRVSFLLKNFMDFSTENKILKLMPGSSEELPLKAVFNNSILTMTEDSSVQALIEASYFDNGKKVTYSHNATVNVYDKHRLTWDERGRFAAFVTPKDPPVLNLARGIVGEYRETKDEAQLAAALFDALGLFGLTYIQDPSNPYQLTSGKEHTVDYIQFPRETLERKSGDCDDLVAVYSAGLESMGINTRVLEVPGHMLMMFDTRIPAEGDGYTMNNLYVIHEGTLWVPVETTLVGNSFIRAWEKGSETYYKYKDDGLTVLDVHASWDTFKPASLPDSDWKASGLNRAAIEKKFPGDILSVLKISSQTKTRRYLDIIKDKPGDVDAHLQVGIILAKIGDRKEAMKYFEKVLSLDAKNASAHNNLGNLYMIDDKYQDAVKAYAAAAKLSPNDAHILVNLARAYKRLGNTKSAKATFIKAKKLDKNVQVQYRALALELLNAL
ncbi:MAG: tetratricopeptide repeat protein [Gammaproteobacteria bacterium]|nr:tetratricopeptide repeat protein [Sideroxydans sp.]MBU4045542.1 tetratricopeptide repeat protein [Gammaproteobacteria bacterium]